VSGIAYRRPDFDFDRVYHTHTALFPFHTQPTCLYRTHPNPDGKDHCKDRGGVDDQGSHDTANGNATGEDRRGQTRKTWRVVEIVGGVVIRG
jgi:hypothetical protein